MRYLYPFDTPRAYILFSLFDNEITDFIIFEHLYAAIELTEFQIYQFWLSEASSAPE